MGSCVSSHHTDLEPGTKLEMSIVSKTQNFVIKSPPKQHKTPCNVGNHRVAQDVSMKCSPSPSPTTFRHSAGSKEETFFDSQPWLESDCEDDFLSTNGDFTPSRSNTPVHNTFPTRMGTPPLNKGEQSPAFKPEPSLMHNKRKKLSDLFKESVRGSRIVHDQNVNPFLSRANTLHACARTPPPPCRREKSIRSMQCCLPGLLTSQSYSESKKKTSPIHSF